MLKVIKRDCTEDDFDKLKIENAILKAMKTGNGVKEKIALDIADEIYEENKDKDEIEISKIENLVFDKLIAKKQRLTAKSYEGYRKVREFQREHPNTTDNDIMELIEGISDYWINENSNKNATVVTTQRDYLAGITSGDISKKFLLPPEIVQANEQGIIHFHDMDYFAQKTLSNCFSGDTEFVTNYGVKKFKDFYDGDKVKVKDKDGIWRDATVKNYGKQQMFDVTFTTQRSKKTITCTQNHRWILKDGSITTNLSIGDVLIGLKDSTQYEPVTTKEVNAYTYGFILGDGSDIHNSIGVRARLCGDKNRLLKYFIEAGYIYSVNKQNEYIVSNKKCYSKQQFIDNKCWKLLSSEEKIALFHGYYAADGFKDRNGIATSDLRLVEMIEELSAMAGYYISSKTDAIRNTNYKQGSRLITFRFITKQPVNWLWRVESIVPHYDYNYENRRGNHEYNTPMTSWCVEEPITHSFTLASGIVTGNCCLINLEDMLQNGTTINGVMIEKPHRFITACTIATQIITAVTSSQYGGATITLTHLAPFVRDSLKYHVMKYKDRGFDYDACLKYGKEDLHKEIEDGVQTFNYQINSMQTTNGQAPFLSVFMYLNESTEYKEEIAMITEEFLKQRIIGMKNSDGVYVTQAFPKLLYVLEDDNTRDDEDYWYLTVLAAKCTAKRLVPDYISEKIMKQLKIDKNGNGNVYPCMGCRSFLTPYINENGEPQYYGRLNQGVVTINLPDIALSSEKDMDLFWKIFEERTELCHKALRCRHERLLGTSSDVAPILWQDGAFARLKKHEPIDKLLYGGYSTISLGYAGLYECVKYMTDHSHTDGGIGKEFGLQVMQALNDKCKQWKEEENIDYSIYGSPIESTTYTFAKCLKKRFGIIEGITDRNYITNSYHVPVFENIDAFTKLKLESEFQELSPGGAISYIEVPNLQNNLEAILSVLKFMYENIMYAEINTKSDYCMECGYDGEIKIVDGEDGKLVWECPKCGNRDQSKMSVARRTCGYIGSQYWNQGRTEEIKERVLHL